MIYMPSGYFKPKHVIATNCFQGMQRDFSFDCISRDPILVMAKPQKRLGSSILGGLFWAKSQFGLEIALSCIEINLQKTFGSTLCTNMVVLSLTADFCRIFFQKLGAPRPSGGAGPQEGPIFSASVRDISFMHRDQLLVDIGLYLLCKYGSPISNG